VTGWPLTRAGKPQSRGLTTEAESSFHPVVPLGTRHGKRGSPPVSHSSPSRYDATCRPHEVPV
jgi:hypothetical protein